MLAKAIMILLVITLSAPWASAQSTFGDVVGVVKDQNQGAVPGAQVLLTRYDDGSQHQTTSDADGAFHFVNLKAGNYNAVAAAPGFADFRKSSAINKEFIKLIPHRFDPRRRGGHGTIRCAWIHKPNTPPKAESNE